MDGVEISPIVTDNNDTDTKQELAEKITENVEIIKHIEAYRRNFPDLCEKLKKEYDPNMDTEYLKKELDKIRILVSENNTIKNMGDLCVTTAYFIQDIGEYAGLKLNGPKLSLANIVNSNKETYNSIMKEIICEHNLSGWTKPEYRLAMLTAQCLVVTHAQNASAPAETKPTNHVNGEISPCSSSSTAQL